MFGNTKVSRTPIIDAIQVTRFLNDVFIITIPPHKKGVRKNFRNSLERGNTHSNIIDVGYVKIFLKKKRRTLNVIINLAQFWLSHIVKEVYMSFWQNRRYQEVERISTGDPIRGLANKQFPWQLVYATFVDNVNDTWHYEISCLGVVPDKKKGTRTSSNFHDCGK